MIDLNLTNKEEVRLQIHKTEEGMIYTEMSVVHPESSNEIAKMSTHFSIHEQMKCSDCWDEMHKMLIQAYRAISRKKSDDDFYKLQLERSRYLGQLESQAVKAAIEGHYGLADRLYRQAELYASDDDLQRIKSSRHRCIQMSIEEQTQSKTNRLVQILKTSTNGTLTMPEAIVIVPLTKRYLYDRPNEYIAVEVEVTTREEAFSLVDRLNDISVCDGGDADWYVGDEDEEYVHID